MKKLIKPLTSIIATAILITFPLTTILFTSCNTGDSPLKSENDNNNPDNGSTDKNNNNQTPENIKSIKIKTMPDKIVYYEGENFVPDGLVITATYKDGSTKDIKYNDKPDDFGFTIIGLEKPGNISITVIYASKETQLTVTVNKINYTIQIKNQPEKLRYFINEKLDLTGLVVSVVNQYSNYEDLFSYPQTEFTYTAPDMTTSGSKAVTLSFKYQQTEFNVTINIEVDETSKTVTFGNYTFTASDAGKDITISLPVDEKTGKAVNEVDVISLYNFKKSLEVGDGSAKPSSVSFKESDFTKDTVYQFTLPSDKTNIDVMREMVNPTKQGLSADETKSVEIIPGVSITTKRDYNYDDNDPEDFSQALTVSNGTLNIDASKSEYMLYPAYNGGFIASNDAKVEFSNIGSTTVSGFVRAEDNTLNNIVPVMFSGNDLPVLDNLTIGSETGKSENIYGTNIDKVIKNYFTTNNAEKIKSLLFQEALVHFNAREYLNGNDMWNNDGVYQNNAYEVDVNFASMIPTAGVKITGTKTREGGLQTTNSVLSYQSQIPNEIIYGAGITDINKSTVFGDNTVFTGSAGKVFLREGGNYENLYIDTFAIDTGLISNLVIKGLGAKEYYSKVLDGNIAAATHYLNGELLYIGHDYLFIDAPNSQWIESGWRSVKYNNWYGRGWKYIPTMNTSSPNYQKAIEEGGHDAPYERIE